jgi:hypothetical protein
MCVSSKFNAQTSRFFRIFASISKSVTYMIKRPFEQWLYEDVEKEFSISRIKKHTTLIAWLNVPDALPLHSNVTRLQIALEEYVEMWQEDEIKMMFIAPYL